MPDARDIVVVHPLKLKKEPVFYEMKAFVENGVFSLFGCIAVQDDGVRFDGCRYGKSAGIRLHFACAEEQNARRARSIIERQLYDFQSQPFGKCFRL